MKLHVWDHGTGYQARPARSAPARRQTVAQILRSAYRKHGRDPQTRLAVRRELR